MPLSILPPWSTPQRETGRGGSKYRLRPPGDELHLSCRGGNPYCFRGLLLKQRGESSPPGATVITPLTLSFKQREREREAQTVCKLNECFMKLLWELLPEKEVRKSRNDDGRRPGRTESRAYRSSHLRLVTSSNCCRTHHATLMCVVAAGRWTKASDVTTTGLQAACECVMYNLLHHEEFVYFPPLSLQTKPSN